MNLGDFNAKWDAGGKGLSRLVDRREDGIIGRGELSANGGPKELVADVKALAPDEQAQALDEFSTRQLPGGSVMSKFLAELLSQQLPKLGLEGAAAEEVIGMLARSTPKITPAIAADLVDSAGGAVRAGDLSLDALALWGPAGRAVTDSQGGAARHAAQSFVAEQCTLTAGPIVSALGLESRKQAAFGVPYQELSRWIDGALEPSIDKAPGVTQLAKVEVFQAPGAGAGDPAMVVVGLDRPESYTYPKTLVDGGYVDALSAIYFVKKASDVEAQLPTSGLAGGDRLQAVVDSLQQAEVSMSVRFLRGGNDTSAVIKDLKVGNDQARSVSQGIYGAGRDLSLPAAAALRAGAQVLGQHSAS